MKFLSIATMKDAMFTLPPATARQLTEANLAFMKQQRQAGKILEAYIIPGWKRSVVISEAKSAEEIVQNFNEMPGMGLMDIEIYPLADWDESMKYVIEGLKRVEQQSPAPPK